MWAQAQPGKSLTLSVEEAILLAIRENPTVQQVQLNHVLQKFSLEIQQWQFAPHYSLQASQTMTSNYTVAERRTSKTFNIQPALSLLFPIGTQATLTSTNNVSNHYNPGFSLQVVQPLLRGLGRPIVEAALYNAMDSEKISRLNVEGAVRNTVTGVVNAYLDVVSAENNVEVDEQALQRAQISVKQTALFIKAGHKAGNEIITVQADAASAQTRLENDKNSLLQTRYALLTAIGIDPNTDITFTTLDIPALIKKYHIPTLDQSKKMILENDIQYQVDRITLEGITKRNLLAAEDNTRWKLDLTVNMGTGNGVGGGMNVGVNSLLNGSNQTQSAVLNLTVPIDDRVAKQAVVNARIGLRQAALSLKQEKWSKETSAINGWNSIFSAQRALNFAENAERLQQKTYHISYQKYTYGLIDSLELQSAQLQLVNSQQALIAARIGYLKALVSLDQLMGSTLQTWKVQVKYGESEEAS